MYNVHEHWLLSIMDVWSRTLYHKREVNALFIYKLFKIKVLAIKNKVVFDTTKKYLERYKMKNNIIIAGVPRAGKSTISHQLAKQYGYQHISMDSIIAGFEKCFPETGVNTYAGLSSMDTLHLISGKIAPFIRAMLDSGEYDEFKPGMVLDIYQLLPEDYMKYIYGANCEIFYFITSDVTPEERFAIQKRYDTEKDYTFYKSDEELREGAEYIVEQSICMKEQCQKYGLLYFETARDREQTFHHFLQDFDN